MPVRYFLIDCDPGVDDALALILAFAGSDVETSWLTIGSTSSRET